MHDLALFRPCGKWLDFKLIIVCLVGGQSRAGIIMDQVSTVRSATELYSEVSVLPTYKNVILGNSKQRMYF